MKQFTSITAALLLGVWLSSAGAMAQSTKTVASRDEATAALAAAAPGQTIVFADAEYDLGEVNIACQAAQDRPLVIRAQNVGKAKLLGTTTFTFTQSSYVTLEGFRFES